MLARLWFGILAGPIAWAIDEVIGYTATAHECSTGSRALLHGLTIVALATCLSGALSAWSARPNIESEESNRTDAMAIAGTVLSIAFALVVIATAIPKWILNPCD